MSESKSKIISFRLPAEIGILAQEAASAAGDKNASAWCQKLVINALSKIAESEIAESDQINNLESSSKTLAANDLINIFGNLRQLNLDCFKLLLNDKENYKEFLQIAINSEGEWEAISEQINNSGDQETPRNNESNNAENKSESFNRSGKEEIIENQISAEKVSNEFLMFAREMENEVAEVVAGEPELITNQKDQTIQLGETATQKQMPNRLPFFDLADQ